MKHPGASPAGTRAYFAKFPKLAPPVILGRTGWAVSPVGFGTYRVNERMPGHREALRLALTSGCNLVDTSTNYGDGSSERLVGTVLGELLAEGTLTRDEVVVVTKAGYVQGGNLSRAREREQAGQPYPELVKFSPDCWHCISPAFLEEQLDQSLDRLGLARIDVLLLHNPEYYLKAQGAHAEYYRRIQAAFAYLETEVARGRIQYYGISSNTFPEPRDAGDYTSLETVLELAAAPSGTHHFAVIQFPFNLYEPGAAFEANNTGGKTVLELAALKGLGTLVNRPFNAYAGDRLVRLAGSPAHAGRDTAAELGRALEQAMELEARYPGKKRVPIDQIAWGHILRDNLERLNELDLFRQALTFQIRPTLALALTKLAGDPESSEWAAAYRIASEALFQAFTAHLEAGIAATAGTIAAALDQAAPALRSSRTLSQKVVRVYRSIPGVHCVLAGMRQASYVRDVLELEPSLSAEEAVDAFDAVGEAAGREEYVS